ncbi:MAG TPA: hypothetical protein VMU36_04045 [Spirochaetia bacterium]|nr:hypothetical protein [Spirochaetia bacterium]
MSTSRMLVLVVAALTLPFSLAFAGGAGGVTWSDQHSISGLSNCSLAASEIGGFGHGVSSGGTRTGGFGYAIYSQPGTDSLAGGVGPASVVCVSNLFGIADRIRGPLRGGQRRAGHRGHSVDAAVMGIVPVGALVRASAPDLTGAGSLI